jgi:hypothetical protein
MAITMARNERAPQAFLDSVEPDPADARDPSRLRRIIAAAESLDAARDELRAAVAEARAAGDTWDAIGAALGTTRQAAFQRFGNTPKGEFGRRGVMSHDRSRVAKAAAKKVTKKAMPKAAVKLTQTGGSKSSRRGARFR